MPYKTRNEMAFRPSKDKPWGDDGIKGLGVLICRCGKPYNQHRIGRCPDLADVLEPWRIPARGHLGVGR